MSAVCVCMYVCMSVCAGTLEKPWEPHLLCKCKPLIDCRACSLPFTGWTLPSAGSRGSCQGSVCTPHTRSQRPPFLSFPLSEQAWREAKVRMGTAQASLFSLPLSVSVSSSLNEKLHVYSQHHPVLFDAIPHLRDSKLFFFLSDAALVWFFWQ